MDLSSEGYIHLYPNDQKNRFLQFSILSINLAGGWNRKLKYDTDK
jgi:hypothetical protein